MQRKTDNSVNWSTTDRTLRQINV